MNNATRTPARNDNATIDTVVEMLEGMCDPEGVPDSVTVSNRVEAALTLLRALQNKPVAAE